MSSQERERAPTASASSNKVAWIIDYCRSHLSETVIVFTLGSTEYIA